MSDQRVDADVSESFDSLDMPPSSPLTKEKTRAAQKSWIIELEQSPEFKILESFLQSSGATPENAVNQLVDLTYHRAQEGPVGNHCWMTACCFLEAAGRTAPEQQSRLASLLFSLASVTLTDPSTNEPWKLGDNEGVIWKDLPSFGYTIADEMGSFDGQEADYTPEEAQKWENLTAFLAQLDASTSASPSPLDFSNSWAPTAFTWAFEGGADAGEPSELAVRLACIWLVYDARKLWSKLADPRAEHLTRERWDGWRQGLVRSTSRFVNGTTPSLVARALAQMQLVQDGA